MLDATADAPPARPAEAAVDSGDVADGHPESAPSRVGEPDHRTAQFEVLVAPLDRCDLSGVDRDHGDVAAAVETADAAGSGLSRSQSISGTSPLPTVTSQRPLGLITASTIDGSSWAVKI